MEDSCSTLFLKRKMDNNNNNYNNNSIYVCVCAPGIIAFSVSMFEGHSSQLVFSCPLYAFSPSALCVLRFWFTRACQLSNFLGILCSSIPWTWPYFCNGFLEIHNLSAVTNGSRGYDRHKKRVITLERVLRTSNVLQSFIFLRNKYNVSSQVVLLLILHPQRERNAGWQIDYLAVLWVP